MSLKQDLADLDIANMLEEEIVVLARQRNGSIQADAVVSAFKTVAAMDFGVTVAQLPTNIWQVFNKFNELPGTTIFDSKVVIKSLRSAGGRC